MNNELNHIIEQLKSLEEKIDLLNDITISNGGGRRVTYTRNDFFQMIYDRVTLKGVQRFVAYALGVVVSIFSILSFLKKG